MARGKGRSSGGHSSGGHSSGGGNLGSTSSKSMFSTSSTPAARSTTLPQAKSPPPPAVAPAQQSSGPSFLGYLGSVMMEGAAFSAGSTMARMAVNTALGGSSQHYPADSHQVSATHAPQTHDAKGYTGACASDHSQLMRCMDNKNESDCNFYFSSLQQCLVDSKAKQNEF